ncbi:phage DNA packaging protein J [Salmonella enterica]|nr:phage DNA packaging protein J [Salmonella enterica]
MRVGARFWYVNGQK